MLEALLTYRFLQNAVTAGLLASVVCGIIGVIIVEKKLVMMSGGIAHTAYGGVAAYSPALAHVSRRPTVRLNTSLSAVA